jgi:hypothetical protein
MKNTAGKIEEMFTEITFAEERDIRYPRNNSGCFTDWCDNLFTAVTFGGAGEFDTARDFMGGGTGGGKFAGYCLSGFCTGRA